MGTPTLIDAPWLEVQKYRKIRHKSWEDFIGERVDHIRATDPSLNAWVNLDSEGALRRAGQIDHLKAESNLPLMGMPIGIKDIFDLKGFPTRGGIDAWTRDLALTDSTLVSRLKNAGAIVLGKTVTTPLACFDPPPTRNPWNTNHTPGGSSSGSAVALAACHIAGALGSQTGGSLCRPASYCGVCAMKPTFGLLPTGGMLPVSLELDHPGPMARNLEDLGLLFSILSGQLGNPKNNDKTLPGQITKPIVLGIPSGLFFTETTEPLRVLFHGQIQRLGQNGIRFEEVKLPPDFDSLFKAHYNLMAWGAFQTHKKRFAGEPGLFPPKVAGLIREGGQLTGHDVDEARRFGFHLRQKMMCLMEQHDAWILPGFHEFPPGPESTGVPRFHAPWSFLGWPEISFSVEIAENLLPVGLQVVGRPHSDFKLLALARHLSKHLGRPELPPDF